MTDPAPPMRQLARRRLLARAAILFEAAWLALWPPLAVVGVFLCLALLNIPPLLPAPAHGALLVLFGLAAAGLLVRGAMGIRMPDDEAADRRLETRSGLNHRPLAILTDKPASGGSLGMALWQAHAARSASLIGRLNVGMPRPGLAARDPRALRYAVLLSVAASLGIANTDAPRRLYAALTPSLPVAAGAPAAELQAWIAPPAYTGIAPLFLKPPGGNVSVPAGSHLTVNVSGTGTAPALSLNGRTALLAPLAANSFQTELDLTRGGVLTVEHGVSAMAAWTLTVVADRPPTVAWGGNPGPRPNSQQTRLPWQAADDFGVTKLQAVLHLASRPDAPPLVVAIPLPGGSVKSAHGLSQPDLTAHPWAGLPVTATLVATDAAGQTGTSAPAGFDLPERPFRNPVARLLIGARKTLSQHPEDRGDALAVLDGLLQNPDLFGGDLGAFAVLSGTYYELVRDYSSDAVRQAGDMMWQLALHMEEGQTEQSARLLEAARQNVRDAMDKAREQPNGANIKDLAQKLENLRQAIDAHMRALLEDALHNDTVLPFDPNSMQLSSQDMQALARQAEQNARDGRMADASQQLAQLEKMLDRLRDARVQSGGDKQASGKRQRGKDQQSVIQDMIARQGALLDRARRRTGDRQTAADPELEREADQRTQQALRRGLGELMQQFTDLTGEASPGLGEADQAMRDAAASLNQGQDGAAGDREQQAIAALQKGNRELGRAMAKSGRQGGQDSDGESGSMGAAMPRGQSANGSGTSPDPTDDMSPESRDPLGRIDPGTSAASADSSVPEERERQRTRAIQDELRRRGADRERPVQELDYIDRLLKQF